MTAPEPQFGIDAEGPKGQSLFYGFLPWALANSAQEIEPTLRNELRQLQRRHEDRLLVLLGALIVENAIDRLLAALMPGYQELAKRDDCPFSLKIAIARAFRLIPTRLLSFADTIRKMRNAFAHNLQIEQLADLDPELLASLRGHVQQLNRDKIPMLTVYDEVYHGVSALTVALYVYARHVGRANSYLRSDEFMEHLQVHASSL